MAGRGTSLGPLLIISAIDLLLCRLTAAVMLFLIFQPSQRADRSSALFQDTSGADLARQLAVGGQQAPTIIMLDNLGETNLIAAQGSDYQVISGPSTDSIIFRSLGPAATLHLVPEDMSRQFVAHIALTKDGRLFSNNWSCVGGAASEVTIDPANDPPVTMTCPNKCVPAEKANKPGDVHLVLIPSGAETPHDVPIEKCYALGSGETLESIGAEAMSCGPNKDPPSQNYSSSPDGYECLWTSFQESSPQDCKQIMGDRVGFWQDTLNPTPTSQICKDEGGGG